MTNRDALSGFFAGAMTGVAVAILWAPAPARSFHRTRSGGIPEPRYA